MFLYTRVRNHPYTAQQVFDILGDTAGTASVQIAGDDSIQTNTQLTLDQIEQLKTLWGAEVVETEV